jgi:hypothetical protein
MEISLLDGLGFLFRMNWVISIWRNTETWSCKTAFILSVGAFKPVSTRIEKEADKFASALLIPGETLDGLKGMRDYLTLGDILELSRICSSSAQAAAFRYIRSTEEPCVAVVCNADRVEYAFASDEAAARGFQSLGNPFVPEKSAALLCLKANPGEIIEGLSHTSYWFSERKYGSALWEESVRLGAELFTLTMLSWPEYKGWRGTLSSLNHRWCNSNDRSRNNRRQAVVWENYSALFWPGIRKVTENKLWFGEITKNDAKLIS